MKTFKNIEKNTSAYEICYNLSLMALALFFFFFAFKKKCEDRGQDQQEYPRPEFLDISPELINNNSSQRISKVHVHNHFQEYFVKKKKKK